jgi:hypothetical protein
MTRTQAVSKKLGAVAALAVSVTALSVAAPSLDAFAAPKPSVCSFSSATTATTPVKPAKSEPRGAKKVVTSALSAFGINAAGAETAGTPCTFQLDMAAWGGYSTGTVLSDQGHAELSIGQLVPFDSPANVETVAWARVGCQDTQGFHITKVDLTVTNLDGTQKIVLIGGDIDVPIGANYYTMLAADVHIDTDTHAGTDLSFGPNENGSLVVRSANPGQFISTFHMTIDPIA